MNSSNDIQVNVNADRICEAIAKIGYTPHSAILDIVDNAVSAAANTIQIKFNIKDGAANNTKNGIEEISIFDNGKGMTLEGISLAFDFGADVSYAKNSLSKYGLGLKSAGFSLGRCITVISKAAETGEITARKLDRDEILKKGLVSSKATPSKEHLQFLDNLESGTIVVLSKLRKGIPSAKRVESKLNEIAGTTYLGFIAREQNPLELKVISKDKVHTIEPRDMLFWEEAQESYDPDNYSPMKPVKAMEEEFPHPENELADKIRVKVSLFPRAECHKLASSEEEQTNFKKYNITQENKGLYIYRNGRLIRWGEKPSSLSIGSRELIGFRCSIDFYSDHDDYFHVDVSKQELEFPDEFTELLSRALNESKNQCKDIYDRTGAILGNNPTEGNEFNERTDDFEEEDFDEIDPGTIDEVNKRRKKQQKQPAPKSEPSEAETPDGEAKDEPSEDEPFRRVRYSDQVNGTDLWSSHVDKDNGTFILINKRHPYYALISKIPPADPARLSIESLLFCLASGFNKTARLTNNIEQDIIDFIHSADKRYISQLLSDWVTRNQDLS